MHRGDSPLIVSFPHSGTAVPEELRARFTDAAAELPDTDWCVPELYDFLPRRGTTTITAQLSRYVVDLNRSPKDARLYADYRSTGICPTFTFAGSGIYRAGCEPCAAEKQDRITRYWQPYHDALASLVKCRVRQYGFAVIYDAHSIAPVVPGLFEGELPVLNVGTVHGSSCGPEFETPVSRAVAGSGLTYALNGRFVGGYITRHYGRPQEGCHAIQMEISQQAYLNERSRTVSANLARPLRDALRQVLLALTDAVRLIA